jgi:hypothetical protein
MTTTNYPQTRRQAFARAITEGLFEAMFLSGRLSSRLQGARTRLAVLFAITLLTVVGEIAPALAVTGATGATGNCSTPATTLLTFVGDIATALIVIGGGLFTLLVVLGGVIIMFGGTPRHMHKGLEIVKNAVVGLSILVFGLGIRYLIVDLVFKRPPSSFGNTCS